MRMLNAPDRRQILLSGLAIALAPRSGWAEDARPTKIGIMNDMSSVYSDY
jgi:branched-chain amino acid transport system substrate-binding protein